MLMLITGAIKKVLSIPEKILIEKLDNSFSECVHVISHETFYLYFSTQHGIRQEYIFKS